MIALFIGLVLAVIATILASEMLGWVPHGSRALINLAARRFLALHPKKDQEACEIVLDWEKDALGELGQLRDRPLTGLLFASRALALVPQTAAEYFGLEEKQREPLSLSVIGRVLFRIVDGLVYLVAGVMLVPAILVAVIVGLVFLPAFFVLMGILMNAASDEEAAWRAAGKTVPPKFEAEDSLSAETELADLKIDVSPEAKKPAPEVE